MILFIWIWRKLVSERFDKKRLAANIYEKVPQLCRSQDQHILKFFICRTQVIDYFYSGKLPDPENSGSSPNECKNMRLIFFLTLMAFLSGIKTYAQQIRKTDPDMRSITARADLHYSRPAPRSEAGQPIGNGRMGTLVWTTPQSLRFQINRVDIFGNNSETNNFYQRNTDYCGGAGFVDIDFQSNDAVFNGVSFRQHLSCYDGTVTTEGEGIRTTAFFSSDLDVMVVRVEDNRSFQTPVSVNLRSLRSPSVSRGDHSAVSKVLVNGQRTLLTQVFTEGSYFNKSAVAVTIPDHTGRAWIANDTEVKLSVPAGKKEYTILVSSAATFDRNYDVEARALQILEEAGKRGYASLLETTRQWWHAYWEKSFVELESSDGTAEFVEQNYTYYLYLMGSVSRGDYPVKFNGMLWTTEGDKRNWGNQFWGANQSCLYDALFTANRIDLVDPMFRMYSDMTGSLEVAARQIWGSKGLWIPETVHFDGLPELPENIAAEIRALYLGTKPWEERSKVFEDFASTKHPHNSVWNWKADKGWNNGKWQYSDKGKGPHGNVIHIFSRGAKLAYLYWMKYEFTQDREWLAGKAYPVIQGVAEFYRNLPLVFKGTDGRYHISNVNCNESVWGGRNTSEEISAMMGILPVAIKASEILGADAELRPLWKDLLDNLAPLSLSSDHPEMAGQPVTFVRSLAPVLQGPMTGRPDPNTMPQWCFDFISLESKNKDLMQIAQTTFDGYFPGGINQETEIGILSMLPVAGTILGRKEATEFLIPGQIRMKETDVMENRMHVREGAQTTTAQRLGRASHALHNALLQSVPQSPGEPAVIHVFPAWPDHWNARYSLLARGNFLVSSSFRNKAVEWVEILSRSGSICRIRNPWGNAVVDVIRDDKILLTTSETLITFETGIQETYSLVRKK